MYNHSLTATRAKILKQKPCAHQRGLQGTFSQTRSFSVTISARAMLCMRATAVKPYYVLDYRYFSL